MYEKTINKSQCTAKKIEYNATGSEHLGLPAVTIAYSLLDLRVTWVYVHDLSNWHQNDLKVD